MATTNKNFKVKNGLEVAGEIGVGATPSYGTAGQILSSQGAGNAAAWLDQTSIQTSTVKHLVKNDSGVTLAKGTVVYTKSANGSNILVDKAIATSDQFSSQVLGFLETELAPNASGYCINNGLITNINTNGSTAGDPVWLSGTTAGGFVTGIANKPVAPFHLVYLGVVTRANTNTGEIFVHISNGWELDELHNVSLAAANVTADNEVLAWDNGSQLWINQTASEAGLAALSGATFTGNVAGTNGSFSGNVSATSFTIPTTRTNLVRNPNFETNTTLWSASLGTISRVTTTPQTGTYCLQMNSDIDSDLSAGYLATSSVVIGTAYRAGIYVRVSSGTQALTMSFLAGVGATATTSFTATTSWQFIETATLTATATGVQISIDGAGVGVDVFVDSVIIETTSTYDGTFFDGNTTDAGGVDYAWSGTANASISTATSLVGVAKLSGATFTGNIAGTNISLTGDINANNILSPFLLMGG